MIRNGNFDVQLNFLLDCGIKYICSIKHYLVSNQIHHSLKFRLLFCYGDFWHCDIVPKFPRQLIISKRLRSFCALNRVQIYAEYRLFQSICDRDNLLQQNKKGANHRLNMKLNIYPSTCQHSSSKRLLFYLMQKVALKVYRR